MLLTKENETIIIKNNHNIPIYAKIYKSERLKLQELIPRFTANHYFIYAYLKENIGLKIFKKSITTVSKCLGLNRKTVKKVFTDFETVEILKCIESVYGMPKVYLFNPLFNLQLQPAEFIPNAIDNMSSEFDPEKRNQYITYLEEIIQPIFNKLNIDKKNDIQKESLKLNMNPLEF